MLTSTGNRTTPSIVAYLDSGETLGKPPLHTPYWSNITSIKQLSTRLALLIQVSFHIPNQLQDYLLTEFVAGDEALAQMPRNAANTIYNMKKIIGVKHDDIQNDILWLCQL